MRKNIILIILGFLLVSIVTGCGSRGPSPTRYIVNYDGDFGMACGGGDANTREEVSVYFDTVKLNPYVGGKLVAVKIYHYTGLGSSNPHDFTIKVYGKGTTTTPGTNLYSHVASLYSGWNEVPITAITINSGDELWVGYEVLGFENCPSGADNGPVVSGVNWRRRLSATPSTYTWRTDICSYNFNIRMVIEK